MIAYTSYETAEREADRLAGDTGTAHAVVEDFEHKRFNVMTLTAALEYEERHTGDVEIQYSATPPPAQEEEEVRPPASDPAQNLTRFNLRIDVPAGTPAAAKLEEVLVQLATKTHGRLGRTTLGQSRAAHMMTVLERKTLVGKRRK
jgi:hypothetical protein